MSTMYDMPFFSKGPGEEGKDGVSPTATITAIEGGHKLTIIDINGVKTCDILDGTPGVTGPQGEPGTAGKDGTNGKDGSNGKDGAAGKDGADGRGIASLAINAAGELIVTYTDSTSANIGKIVGETGATGSQGEQGPEGPQGPAYVLTEQDKAEIVAAVLAEINAQA